LLPGGRLTWKAIAQGPIGQQRARIKPAARPRISTTFPSDASSDESKGTPAWMLTCSEIKPTSSTISTRNC
jgi:hypothetical protein